MGKIFVIMGKSASGKDTIYKKICEAKSNMLQSVVLYTTRPMRAGEVDGREYHFVTEAGLDWFRQEGKVIESRTYETIHGPWTYATVDDGSWNLKQKNYLMLGVPDSYHSLKEYFGEDAVVPVYIEVEDGERLRRALDRESLQAKPSYEEVCRRFLADQQDFSKKRLEMEGITTSYENRNLEECVAEIIRDMKSVM